MANSKSKNARRGTRRAKAQATAVDLGPALDVTAAAEVRGRLCAALETGQALALDASALQSVDGAGVQLLCAFFHDAHARGVAVTWTECPENLRNAARLFGVAQRMGLANDGATI